LMTTTGAQEVQEFDWSVDLGVEHTDNATRSASDEVSDVVGTAGLSLTWDVERPRLDADVDADLRYLDYFDNTFDSEVAGGLAGSLSYFFIPERFLWLIEDNFGQIATVRTLADTPANRQNFNYLTTGPQIFIPLSGRFLLELSGLWSDTYIEEGDEDSEELFGSLALVRRLSDTSNLSLHGSVSETQFDDASLEEYEIQEGFLRYEVTTSRTELTLDGGYTVLNQAEEESDGILARLDLTRPIAARSRIALHVGTEFSSTADTFRRGQTVVGVDVGPGAAIASNDGYQSDYAYVTWTTDWARSAILIEAGASTEDHERLNELDREQAIGSVSWSRELSRVVGIELRAHYLEENYTETNDRFDEWSVGAGLDWQLSARYSLLLRFDHFEGSGVGGLRDYEENTAFLGLSFGRRR
jgi:hypothetical protein